MSCWDCLDEFTSEYYTNYGVIMDYDTSSLEAMASPSLSEDVVCLSLPLPQLNVALYNGPMTNFPEPNWLNKVVLILITCHNIIELHF